MANVGSYEIERDSYASFEVESSDDSPAPEPEPVVESYVYSNSKLGRKFYNNC